MSSHSRLRNDDHDNPFLQKQATPGPSRQQQQQNYYGNRKEESKSTVQLLPTMPSPIPVSRQDVDRQRLQSDLDHSLDSLSDDAFNSDHTFSRLGGFGKESIRQQSRNSNLNANIDREDGWESESSFDDAMNLTQGVDSSFDAHARRSGLIAQPPTPFRPRNVVQEESTSPSSSSISTHTLEFPRTAPAMQSSPHLGQTFDQFEDEKSIFVGQSPGSTLGHHASAITLGAGIFAPRTKGAFGNYGDGEEGEYDPDRSVEGLIEVARGKGGKENTSGVNESNNPPQSSIFTTNSSKPLRHLHRPIQPSPLRAQANSPLTSTTTIGSRSLSQSAKLAYSDKLDSRGSHGHSQSQGQSLRNTSASQIHSRSGRKVLAEIDGVDNARSASGEQMRDRSNISKHSSARITSRTQTQDEGEWKAASRWADQSVGTGVSVAGTGAGRGDLTGLTGMLATPAKGLLYRRVGDDGERKTAGVDIEGALRKMETDMKSLKQETERSRRRIQELEAELERARIMAHKAEREADGERERRVEVEDKVEGLRDERDALEAIVQDLNEKMAALEANLQKEMGRVQMVQQEMINRSPARPRSPLTVQSASLADLVPLVNHLLKKVDGLESEVNRLKDVVEGAYERTIGEITLKPADEPKRPNSARKTQVEEGTQAAAYESADPQMPVSALKKNISSGERKLSSSRKAMFAQLTQEDGDSSPSPRSRIQGESRSLSMRSSEGDENSSRRKSRRSINEYKPDAVQEDPAASPFPAIRGDRLEREFFSPAPKPTASSMQIKQDSHLKARVEDEVDEGYGGEEPVAQQAQQPVSQPRVQSGNVSVAEIEHELDAGRVPPQTNIMKVLRELEDDYKHYLSIYSDLAEQYRRMGPLSSKRHVLAEHLKEVIDTMEQKANQVACLTEVLVVRDKPYMAPVIKAARASKARMSVPDTVRAIRKDLGPMAVQTPARINNRPRARRNPLSV